jgi:uncharacterized protein (TIGR02145 family)
MRKFTALIAILMLCAASLFAQAPEKFTYQAVVRNASNALVTNANVGVRVSILQGSATGNAVYVETHTATTNANGLLTLEIGGGTVQQGIFTNINWSSGSFFLKTETDPNGGSNYSMATTQQLLSVPYALYSKEAGNGFSGDYNDLTNKPTNVSAFNNDAGYVTNNNIPSIPMYVSAFINDMGYLTGYTETDPQFNAWDKDYNDLINTPVIPTVPTNVSAFNNDAGYITNADIPEIPTVPTNVSAFNNDAGYITNADIPEIPTVPTNVSAFTNDVPYLVAEQQILSISNDTIFLTGGSFVKLPTATVGFSGDYNDLTNKPTIPQTVGELTNDANYITLEQVPAQVNADWNATSGAAEILNKPTIPTVPTDVSAFNNDAGYITNADIPEISTVPTNVSAFNNDAGYITNADIPEIPTVPDSVSAFINDAGYLTNALCDTEDFCQLVQMVRGLIDEVASLRDSLEEMKNTMVKIKTPTVVIDSITDIQRHSAKIWVSVTNDGGGNITRLGFCWDTLTSPTVEQQHLELEQVQDNRFAATMGSLNLETLYYVRAYAANNAGLAYSTESSFTTMPSFDAQPCPGHETVTDYDGNVYNTVMIDDQCWTKENLRSQHFPNGIEIPLGNGSSENAPYRYAPNNDENNVAAYGYLYNWQAFMNGAGSSNANPSGIQGICPQGWHVPSMAEWIQLTDYVSSQSQYWCGENSSFIAKALSSATGWTWSYNITCTVANDKESNNITGFSATPAGYNSQNNSYYFGKNAMYYSSTENSSSEVLGIVLEALGQEVATSYVMPKEWGISVRCVLGAGTNVPDVSTDSLIRTSDTSMHCIGQLSDPTGILECGFCWDTMPNPVKTSNTIVVQPDGVQLQADLAELQYSTTYYVRAYATNELGTGYGEVLTFSTPYPPTVVIDSLSNTAGEMSVCVSIPNDGGSPILERGFCWSYNENPTLDENVWQDNNLTSSSFCHSTGDIEYGRDIHVRAYAVNVVGVSYSSDTVLMVPNPNDGQPCSGIPTMTDADGNVYPTVQIGNQCWIKKNLRTTQNNAVHFQVEECGGFVNPSCYIPRNDPSLVETYGYLYNWAAISGRNGPVNNDSTYCQGICPHGWHVPSKFDWQVLLNYVESQPDYGWISLLDSVFVTNGTNTAPNVNRSGFSLRNAGIYYSCWQYNPSFIGQWTSSFGCYNASYPCNMEGYQYDRFQLSTGMPARECLSVRCLKTPDEKVFSGAVNIGNYYFLNDTLVVEIADITATGSPIMEVGACWSDGGLCINLYNAQTIPYDPSHSGPIYFKLPIVNTTDIIYFKAFINLAAGTIYSDMITLTIPSVNTNEPTNITDSTATVGGMITSDGGYDVTACGVCWSTSQNPTIAGDHTVEVAEAGHFTSLLTGLNSGTTYYARAYATNNQTGTRYGKQVTFITSGVPAGDAQPCPGYLTVTDYDGNVYNTVKIGDQCWMKENMRCLHYSDGTEVPSSAYPNNDTNNVSSYGLLYKWDIMMYNEASSTANPSGIQGICPMGWHVPSDAEWTQLTNYVSSIPEYKCNNSNRIAKALGSQIGWNSNNGECTLGDQSVFVNNMTGFSAVPAGDYNNYSFSGFGNYSYFWSSTAGSDYNAALRFYLRHNNANIYLNNSFKVYSYSVRCLCDEIVGENTATLPKVTTGTVSNITEASAICSGEVTADGGLDVTAYGVCWRTEPNPTVDDNHTSDGTGTGAFISNLTGLNSGTLYYVRAYATNSSGTRYGANVIFSTPIVDEKSCPLITTVTDIEGNAYGTVQIGDQCWMRENLRTTKNAEGIDISNGKSSTSYTAPYYYNYKSSGIPLPIRGYLYNWSAAMEACPAGWHLPSDEEWNTMEATVSGSEWQTSYETSTGYRGSHAGKLAGGDNWASSTTSGAPGDYDNTDRNASGFSAVPAGYCYSSSFYNAGNNALFWSSTQTSNYNAYCHILNYSKAGVSRSDETKSYGRSVRCLHD